jgi:hypothetical protein
MVRHDQPGNSCEYWCVGLFLCVTAILLCACGGGSSSSTPPPPQNPLPAIASISRTSFTAGAKPSDDHHYRQRLYVKFHGGMEPEQPAYSLCKFNAVAGRPSRCGRCFGRNRTNHRAPGGGVSTGATLTIDNPVPAISKVNPASALVGSSDTLRHVSGSGFLPSTVRAATFSMNSPAPVITAISPRIVPPGAAATITITGTGFESNSAVQWNGSARPGNQAITRQPLR